jgi:hypothetical protein
MLVIILCKRKVKDENENISYYYTSSCKFSATVAIPMIWQNKNELANKIGKEKNL